MDPGCDRAGDTVGVSGFFSIDGSRRAEWVCWGREQYNRAYLISSTSVRAYCELMDSRHYSCINNDRRFGCPSHIKGSLVIPPDSENVALVSIRSLSGIPPGRCSLIELELDITESYGVLVGRTLVDTSDWSASVLLINPGSDMVVLPLFSCVGNLVPVSAVSDKKK